MNEPHRDLPQSVHLQGAAPRSPQPLTRKAAAGGISRAKIFPSATSLWLDGAQRRGDDTADDVAEVGASKLDAPTSGRINSAVAPSRTALNRENRGAGFVG